MSRQSKIFILCHAYPLFLICQLQWRLGDFIYTVAPMCFIIPMFLIWRDNSVKLNTTEKRSLNFFLYFFSIMQGYYVFCIFGNTEWIADHNFYFAYFLVFVLIFYTLSSVTKRLWH